MPPSRGEITENLAHWADQDQQQALSRLMPLVLDELRRLARQHLSREGGGHTLQPTELVNEVYLRLVETRIHGFDNRSRFFAFAARLMREILVEHARAKQAAKRGGDLVKVEIEEALGVPGGRGLDLDTVLAIDEALARLEQIDERASRLVELRSFAGLTLPEAAEALDVSLATVERSWSVAKRWLGRELQRQGDAGRNSSALPSRPRFV